MTMHDFDHATTRPTPKDGQAKKYDMLYDGRVYLLKQTLRITPRKNHPSDTSYRDTPTSEWLGCHVFEHFGIPVQETILGTFNGKTAVGCLDFIANENENLELVPFQALVHDKAGRNSNKRSIEYDTLFETFDTNPALRDIKEPALRRFWQTVIVDAVIGNCNRHPGNWGYLRDKTARFDSPMIGLAPVYDCGSTFAPFMSEDAMEYYLEQPNALKERVAKTPYSNVSIANNPLSYSDLMTHPDSALGRSVLIEMADDIRNLDITAIAKQADVFSDTQIHFFDAMVKTSVEINLQPAYDLACREHNLPYKSLTTHN